MCYITLEIVTDKFYVRHADLIKQYEVFLSRNDILAHDHKQWNPPSIRYYTNLWPCYRVRPCYRVWLSIEYREDSTKHLRRVWHADVDVYSSRHLILYIFGLAYVLLLLPVFLVLLTLNFEHPSELLFCLSLLFSWLYSLDLPDNKCLLYVCAFCCYYTPCQIPVIWLVNWRGDIFLMSHGFYTGYSREGDIKMSHAWNIYVYGANWETNPYENEKRTAHGQPMCCTWAAHWSSWQLNEQKLPIIYVNLL